MGDGWADSTGHTTYWLVSEIQPLYLDDGVDDGTIKFQHLHN